MRKHYEKIIRDNDNRVKKALRIQVMDEGSPYYGGCPEETGLMDAKYTVYRIYDMAGAYSNSGSLYYRDGGGWRSERFSHSAMWNGCSTGTAFLTSSAVISTPPRIRPLL